MPPELDRAARSASVIAQPKSLCEPPKGQNSWLFERGLRAGEHRRRNPGRRRQRQESMPPLSDARVARRPAQAPALLAVAFVP